MKKGDDGLGTKLHFAEDCGLMFEQEGMPRMAGRIFGWMLVAEAPHQSLQELAEVLHASPGSISSMTRYLIQLNAIERVALPGHRRDYVRLKEGSSLFLPDQWVETITAVRKLAEHGLELIQGKDPGARQRLTEIRDLYTFLEEQFPSLVERWNKRRAERA